MTIDLLMDFGQMVVDEQENVKRVQLADAYLGGAELAGASRLLLLTVVLCRARKEKKDMREGKATQEHESLPLSLSVLSSINQTNQSNQLFFCFNLNSTGATGSSQAEGEGAREPPAKKQSLVGGGYSW